ncbi:sensor histidine kinase [Paenibacillus sp. y28]|uniref:sensor histidine kinase n=1 Tax=Paenibacillus sp. y28 TaxID=3129110 RepID=UPI003017AB19
MRTLYTRVVLVFLAAALAGLLTAYAATTVLFEHRESDQFQADMLLTGQEMIRLLRQGSDLNWDEYAQSLATVHAYSVLIYNQAGELKRFGSHVQELDESLIPREEIAAVLHGEVRRSEAQGPPEQTWIGVPFWLEQERLAMILQPGVPHAPRNGKWILDVSLIITLIVGSLFILLAASYIIKPLRELTKAVHQVARGDFNVSLSWRDRADELGILAQGVHQMAQSLNKMEGMRQDFVSNVSHEIQSPLTSIAGFSKALRNEALTREQQLHYLDIIEHESSRLSRLSENLLKLASLDSDHHPFQPQRFELDEQLRRMIVLCEPQWSAKRLHLDLQLTRVDIVADEDQCSQIWLNLLSNAIKFTPDGGTIGVEITRGTGEVLVRISDSGAGISEEERSRIFERFYKADQARRRTQSGSGLGLAIVSRIVALHQGRIEVWSEPGQGSVFTVTLPTAATGGQLLH